MTNSYYEGWAANQRGVGQGANPYSYVFQPLNWQQWYNGWCDAHYTDA